MTRPYELSVDWPMDIAGGKTNSTFKVWEILKASFEGNLEKVQQLTGDCPELAYAQFNYTPPIHFAVREGHEELVNYLLSLGACDPAYRTYPFLEYLAAMAGERGHQKIVLLLKDYAANPALQRFKGDNGEIHFPRTALQTEFEQMVDKENIPAVRELLEANPGLATDPTYFWGEGILLMPAKEGNRELMELLLQHGAIFPAVSKWPHGYYFEKLESAAFTLEHGMSADHKTWQETTILHYMAHKGRLEMAALLIKHGASLDAIDDEYQSTPLGLAARAGHTEMVKYLLTSGADPLKTRAEWARPIAWARSKGYGEIIRILS